MSAEWQRPEGGGLFAIWLIRSVGLYGGRAFARVFLYPITLYFFMRRGPERRAARAYFERIQGQPGRAWQVMRQIHSFASTILDRVFLLSRRLDAFSFESEGLGKLQACLAGGRGVMLIGSHQGSFEALRALSIDNTHASLRIILDKQQTPALTRLLEELAPDLSAAVIDISKGGPEAVLAMSEAARQGQMVAILADRAREGESTIRVPFLGSPAAFPLGPWQLAAALKVPVFLCFGMYLGGARYRLVFEPFSDGIDMERHARGAQMQAVVSRYATRVEHYAKLYPYNWFNFYDFWQAPSNGTGSGESAGLSVHRSHADA